MAQTPGPNTIPPAVHAPLTAHSPPESLLSHRGRGNLMATNEAFQALMEMLANAYDETKNPQGVISLGVAENALLHDEIVGYMNSHLKLTPKDLTYGDAATGSNRLKRNLATFVNEHFNPLIPVDAGDIIVSSGVSGVLDQLAWGICNEGEGVLIGRPVYSGFVTDLDSRSNVVPCPVAFGEIDPFSLEAVKCYVDRLHERRNKGMKIRALILTTPHNPFGRCYTQEVMQAYMLFCQHHSLHLISDEIYAMSTFSNPSNPDAAPFRSILSIPNNGLIDPNLVHVLYGMSKDFSANGLRLGLIISKNKPLHHAMSSIVPFSWPSAPADVLWSTILEDKEWLEWYLAENRKRLGDAYQALTRILDRYGIEYIKGSSAGFFLWCNFSFATATTQDVPSLAEDQRLNKRILRGGVYLATSQGFQGEKNGWYRVTFSLPRKLLMLGLGRLLSVLLGREIELDENGEEVKGEEGVQKLREYGRQRSNGSVMSDGIEEEVARLAVQT